MNAAARAHTVEVTAPDGSVRLYAPATAGQPWQAQVWPVGTPVSIEVAWSRAKGMPSRYVCAEHGLGHRRDHCPHVIAALNAHALYTKEN